MRCKTPRQPSSLTASLVGIFGGVGPLLDPPSISKPDEHIAAGRTAPQLYTIVMLDGGTNYRSSLLAWGLAAIHHSLVTNAIGTNPLELYDQTPLLI